MLMLITSNTFSESFAISKSSQNAQNNPHTGVTVGGDTQMTGGRTSVKTPVIRYTVASVTLPTPVPEDEVGGASTGCHCFTFHF